MQNQIAGKKKKKNPCSFSMPQPNIKLTFQKKKKKVIFKISNVPKKCLPMKQTNQNRSSGYSNFN